MRCRRNAAFCRGSAQSTVDKDDDDDDDASWSDVIAARRQHLQLLGDMGSCSATTGLVGILPSSSSPLSSYWILMHATDY